MSLSNGQAERSGHPPRSPRESEPSPYAPKWVREGRMPPRKVVPLRLPAAPQLMPGPVAVSAAPTAPRPPYNLDPDEAALKRLMQRHSPDPQPLTVPPMQDPVGLALGVVARLIVAGCAAAAVAMLLIGAIPFPFKLGNAAMSETTSLGPVAWSLDTPVAEQPVKSTQRLSDDESAANAGNAGIVAAAAPPPARVATVSVRAAQAGVADQWMLDAGEVERLTKRGEDYLAQGDIAAARLILARAAEARDARAAFSLAATYDPTVLKQLRVVGFRPDVAQARAWYEKAAAYGSAEASQRLALLPNTGP
jgi:hypothetical protein